MVGRALVLKPRVQQMQQISAVICFFAQHSLKFPELSEGRSECGVLSAGMYGNQGRSKGLISKEDDLRAHGLWDGRVGNVTTSTFYDPHTRGHVSLIHLQRVHRTIAPASQVLRDFYDKAAESMFIQEPKTFDMHAR